MDRPMHVHAVYAHPLVYKGELGWAVYWKGHVIECANWARAVSVARIWAEQSPK